MHTNTPPEERKFRLTPEEQATWEEKRILYPLRRFHRTRKRRATAYR